MDRQQSDTTITWFHPFWFAILYHTLLHCRVPANGYYFFVFNSENEVQTNYIRARFDLQKTKYDVAKTKLRECTNSTERCDLSLDIFSSQKVTYILILSVKDFNESLLAWYFTWFCSISLFLSPLLNTIHKFLNFLYNPAIIGYR